MKNLEKKLQRPSDKILERGKRAKMLVKMTGLTQKEFLDKHGISTSTFNQWTKPKINGLSEAGAYKLIEAAEQEGVICQFSWLFHGLHPTPTIIGNSIDEQLYENVDNRQLKNEIALFKNSSSKAVIVKVTDAGTRPIIDIGDFVGGYKETDFEQVQKLIGSICIVETQQEHYVVRLLLPGSKEGLFNLQTVNENEFTLVRLIQDIKPISTAKVMRVWKED